MADRSNNSCDMILMESLNNTNPFIYVYDQSIIVENNNDNSNPFSNNPSAQAAHVENNNMSLTNPFSRSNLNERLDNLPASVDVEDGHDDHPYCRNPCNESFREDFPINPNNVRSSTPRTGQSNDRDNMDNIVKLLNNIALNNKIPEPRYDVRHIDNFNGEGSEVSVASKLVTFINDFEDYFNSRKINESDKIILIKQKLSGSAKILINSHRPKYFVEVKDILNEAFGKVQTDDETLLALLRNMKMKELESFNQYTIRVTDVAKTVATKLGCNVNDKYIFNAVSKALLSNFESHIASTAGVVTARKGQNINQLIRELYSLVQLDKDILLVKKSGRAKKVNTVSKDNVSVKDSSSNPFYSKNDNVQQRQVNCFSCGQLGHTSPYCPNMICGRCFQPGHLILNCAAPMDKKSDETVQAESAVPESPATNMQSRSDIAENLGITPQYYNNWRRSGYGRGQQFFRPRYSDNRGQRFFRPRFQQQ